MAETLVPKSWHFCPKCGAKRTGSPLVALRERFPAMGWKSVRDGFGWRYEAEDGSHAHWVSFLTPRYDGDDETCESRFMVYPTSDTGIPGHKHPFELYF